MFGFHTHYDIGKNTDGDADDEKAGTAMRRGGGKAKGEERRAARRLDRAPPCWNRQTYRFAEGWMPLSFPRG